MRALSVAAFLACLLAQPSPRSDEEILAEAQTAYRQGVEHKDHLIQARRDFARAADAYLQLHRAGVGSAALYRNLGDSAILADRWPEAIWAYHLGLRFDANESVMREHLAYARAKVLYPAAGQGRPDSETWPTWLHRPTLLELFIAFALTYALACFAGLGAWHWRSSRFIVLTLALVFVAFLCGAGMWFEAEKQSGDRAAPLVVIASNAPFYRGNGSSYPQHAAVPILPRGLEARLVHRRGAWLQIRLSTGEIGWLPRSQVLIVEP
jgi:hypothetical protein